ncbi:hypothetical protein V5O48_008260 [Marasmius crinis-equi]|uniref:Cytochrome P450 n=1 Tax=Marasmius crinis-equi TaxID=585013 RepID=A0ABR3FEI9_9AGAR
MAGPNLFSVHGKDHKRHRRIMNPAFSPSAAKALVPVFCSAASAVGLSYYIIRSVTSSLSRLKLINRWKEDLSVAEDQSKVFNIPYWTSRATLDAIGHAGFNYNFGAMENEDNRLAAAYHNLMQVSTAAIGQLH